MQFGKGVKCAVIVAFVVFIAATQLQQQQKEMKTRPSTTDLTPINSANKKKKIVGFLDGSSFSFLPNRSESDLPSLSSTQMPTSTSSPSFSPKILSNREQCARFPSVRILGKETFLPFLPRNSSTPHLLQLELQSYRSRMLVEEKQSAIEPPNVIPLVSLSRLLEGEEESSVQISDFNCKPCSAVVSSCHLSSGSGGREEAVALRCSSSNKAASHQTLMVSFCNEGVPSERSRVPIIVSHSNGDGHEKKRKTPSDVSRGLHLLTCWEYVGYHLWQCMLALFARITRYKKATASMLSEARLQKLLSILNASLAGDEHEAATVDYVLVPSTVSPNAHQGVFGDMWSIIFGREAVSLSAFSKSSSHSNNGHVYDYVFMGSPRPSEVLAHEWKAFREHIVSRMAKIDPNNQGARNSTVVKIIVVERVARYRFLNLDQVALTASAACEEIAASLSRRCVVEVFHFEKLPTVRAQMAKAREADVLIGVHGNGLTWAGLLREGSALVEVWPSHAFNGNYRNFADNLGIHYFSLVHSTTTGSVGNRRRRYDFYCNLLLLRGTVAKALRAVFAPLDKQFFVDAHVEKQKDGSFFGPALEQSLFYEWTREYKPLWRRSFGFQKKHFAAILDFTAGHQLGFVGVLARSYHHLAPFGVAAPAAANASALRSVCGACHRHFSVSSSRALQCMISCMVIHRVALCLGSDFGSSSHFETVASWIKKSEEIAARAAAEVARDVREAQRKFFSENQKAREHWNMFNPEDRYS